MRLSRFSVGPIVGDTSTHSLRLWGRGLKSIKETDSFNCLGVARIKRWDESDYGPPQPFAMERSRDYTGTVDFRGLLANTAYTYQMGWIEASEIPQDINWSASHRQTVTTASDNPNEPRTFVFGSCRYLLKFREGAIWEHEGDRTFEQILELPQPPDRFLMLGDQIYADDLKHVWPDRTLADFNLRYRMAFSSPSLRKLMAKTPTAMMLDDHEIQDNWPFKSATEPPHSENDSPYHNAIQAFYNYQLSPSTGTSSQHWYSFQDGCCDFFLADARTDRSYKTVEQDGQIKYVGDQIISDRQMDAIKTWLSDGSDRVKILASSVLIFPDAAVLRPGTPSNPDQWPGFHKQQMELLDYIRVHNIRRVIFIAGDVHASMAAKLKHPKDSSFQIISIVSSPFFWPTAHGRAKNFQLTGPLGSSEYFVDHDVSPVMSKDNFTQVKVTPDDVQIEIVPRRSKLRFWRQQTPIKATYSFS